MRKPPPAPNAAGAKAPPAAEPSGDRALERARQFAMQRGLPAPSPGAAEARKPVASGKATTSRTSVASKKSPARTKKP